MGFGGGTQKVVQKNETVLTPEQKELQSIGLKNIKSALGPDGTAQTDVPEVQGFDPAQQAAQAGVLEKSASGGTLDQIVQGLTGAQNFLSGDVLDVNNNPALQRAIEAALRPITENFQSVVLPGLRSDAIQAGGLGDPKYSSHAQLASDRYLRQVGDTAAGITTDAYGRGLEALVGGLSLAPQSLRAALFPEAAAESVGAQRRDLAQSQADRQFQSDLFPVTLGNQLIATAAGAPGGGSVSSVSGAQPGSNWTQILGAGLTGLSQL